MKFLTSQWELWLVTKAFTGSGSVPVPWRRAVLLESSCISSQFFMVVLLLPYKLSFLTEVRSLCLLYTLGLPHQSCLTNRTPNNKIDSVLRSHRHRPFKLFRLWFWCCFSWGKQHRAPTWAQTLREQYARAVPSEHNMFRVHIKELLINESSSLHAHEIVVEREKLSKIWDNNYNSVRHR